MKYLTNLDLNKNQILNATLQKLAAHPTPVDGLLYYNTTDKRAYIYNGNKWVGMDCVDAEMTGEDIVVAINASLSTIDNDNLSSGVNSAVTQKHTHTNKTILDATTASFLTTDKNKLDGLQTALDGKVNNERVLTDVPANAKFTDTVYTHPNHTAKTNNLYKVTVDSQGHISAATAVVKADITALGIPAQDTNTTYSEITTAEIDAGTASTLRTITGQRIGYLMSKIPNIKVNNAVDADTVNGKTVAVNVPANAKFTDTTYSVFNSTTDGLAPKSGGGTTKYLREDGTWVVPPDTKYSLPIATSTVLGGIKSGTDITIDTSGNVSVKDNSHSHTIANVTGLQAALDGKETPSGASSKASVAEGNAKTYTDTKIAELVGSAPETLDTLNELASALGSDPNFATTITNEIAKKSDKFAKAIGDGVAISYVVTHNLNSRDVVVMIRETASPYAQVITDVEMTTVNTITVKFATAPTSNQYTVTIIG